MNSIFKFDFSSLFDSLLYDKSIIEGNNKM